MIRIETPQRLYIVGIKGVGMTALAQVLVARGHSVSGSDVAETFFTDAVLAEHDIPVYQGFSAQNLPVALDGLIYSTAYSPEHPEIAEAQRRGIPLATYPEVLGELFRLSEGISIAGSHGKTTTTAMVGACLIAAGEDPTVIVGSHIPDFHGNARIGKSTTLVVETDEYQDKFALYAPQHLILTNIDYDHPDFFATPEAYTATFERFLARLPAEGILVTNADDEITTSLLARLGRKSSRFGLHEGEVRLAGHAWAGDRERVDVRIGKDVEQLFLRMPGRHNALNACAATAFALARGIPFRIIKGALESLSGVKRRFEYCGMFQGAQIFDDYAHHPTELAASLAAARERFPDKRLIAVFQPHTYSRTQALLNDFAAALRADEVCLLEIYGSAREQHGGVSSEDLRALLPKSQKSNVFQNLESVAVHLRQTVGPNDVVCLLGAGDVWRVAQLLPTTL